VSATGWQISAGNLSELLRPAAYTLTLLLSTCVLADARRRGFKPYAVAAWTLLTFLFPLILLPLYLATRLYMRPPDAPLSTSDAEPTEDAARVTDLTTATEISGRTGARREDISPLAGVAGGDSLAGQSIEEQSLDSKSPGGVARPVRHLKWRFALPLLYAAVIFTFGGLYFYADYRSAEARLARAEQAKLYGQYERAIIEYRAALVSRDDPHTRKLLGLELSRAGHWPEALTQLRAAERDGEPDARLPFYVATALDGLNNASEAARAYQQFLAGPLCSEPPPDVNCAAARERLAALQGETMPR
jgi:hypothetical protein